MDLNTRTRVVCAAVATVLSLPAWADSALASFEAAQAQFERGRRGDSGANEQASEQFQKLSEQEPRNPLYLAYYGSSLTIRGRDAWAPWNKWKYTERGLDLLNKAVGMLNPGHDSMTLRGISVSLETLLVASSTFLGVPDMFHRLEAGKAAVAAAMASPAFGSAPASVRAQLWYQASIVARKEGKRDDEARSLRQALELWSDGPFAGEARQRLKELNS